MDYVHMNISWSELVPIRRRKLRSLPSDGNPVSRGWRLDNFLFADHPEAIHEKDQHQFQKILS
jgi:hypothetical protein